MTKNNGRTLGQVIMVLVILLIIVNIPIGYYGRLLNGNTSAPPPVISAEGQPLRLTHVNPTTQSQLPFAGYLLWWFVGGGALVGVSFLAWRVIAQSQPDLPQGFLSSQISQAITYQAQITHLLQTTTTPHNQAQHAQLAEQLAAWVMMLQTLSQHLTKLQQDPLWQQDLAAVPRTIATLQRRLPHETNPMLREQLTHSLHNHQQQLILLAGLQNSIQQTEAQIANTLALLGTMYAQLLTTQSTHQTADYSRLTTDVTEEVARLQDRLEALQEVKAGR